jgi:predicted kinase
MSSIRKIREDQKSLLIVVSGLPGLGKSTAAEDIARKIKFPVFSVDPIESAILKSGISRSFETGLAAYLVAEALAAEQLCLGISVIIDAVSPVQEARDIWRGLADIYQSRLIIIECVLNADLHKQRIEARVRNISGIPEVTWDDVEKRRKEYLEWKEDRLILDTSDTRESNIRKTLKYIETFMKEKE